MAKLVIMIGIPGSGKSTLIQTWSQAQCCLIISTDEIRAQLFGDEAIQGSWLLVWQEVQRQFREAVEQIHGGTVDFAIYDATNTRRRNRRAVMALARSVGFTEIVGVWLDPPLELCVQRNQSRFRQVPDAVVQRMYRQLWSCPPRLREGLDLLLHYGTTPDLEELLKQFEQQVLAKY
jgi:predicted kinase